MKSIKNEKSELDEVNSIPITDFIKFLHISDEEKAQLCACLAVMMVEGYEQGFKCAMMISTGLESTDPEFIEIMNDLKEISHMDPTKYAKNLWSMMKNSKQGEKNE